MDMLTNVAQLVIPGISILPSWISSILYDVVSKRCLYL